ncbi:methyltransferase domain-containing protein [Streptomyces sp. HNM0575]|nr:methyltransferase domain-containing protein [Streptomyces sp. HNM0575]
MSPEGPGFAELVRQALSSTERGYDLLAPKFDGSPFRTPDNVLDATAEALRRTGPYETGLDLCCGTGAGVDRVLRRVCGGTVTGVDFSGGMLAEARRAVPDAEWVRADVRALPAREAFDLAVSFGAFGHFLPRERPVLFAQVHAALRPGGLFAFPVAAPPRVGSLPYWTLWGFDAAMRVRNALWHPRFVMYYRRFRLPEVRSDLVAAGFTVATLPLESLGRRPDGAPRCRLVLARRGD